MSDTGIPSIGFYFHYPTREVFYRGERAGWIVPASDSEGVIQSWRFIADDEIYEESSASSMGPLVQYVKGHVLLVNRKIEAD